MKNKNTVLVISGASAVGKTAVANAIIEKDNRFTFLRSATTRAKRKDGNDNEYIYLTECEFKEKIKKGEILEYMVYAGNMYGTLYSELDLAFKNGKIPLLVLDTKGLVAIKSNKELCVCTVFVYATLDVIEQRLSSRYLTGVPTEKERQLFLTRKERNLKDYREIYGYAECVYSFVKNEDTLDKCRDEVLRIFGNFEKDVPRDDRACQKIADSLYLSAKK